MTKAEAIAKKDELIKKVDEADVTKGLEREANKIFIEGADLFITLLIEIAFK